MASSLSASATFDDSSFVARRQLVKSTVLLTELVVVSVMHILLAVYT